MITTLKNYLKGSESLQDKKLSKMILKHGAEVHLLYTFVVNMIFTFLQITLLKGLNSFIKTMHSPSNWKYYNFLISLFSFFQSIKYLKNKTLLEKRSNHTLKCIPK